MNVEEVREAVKVMQAWTEGKPIEYSEREKNEWEGVMCPAWDWNTKKYRVRKSRWESPVERWLVIHANGDDVWSFDDEEEAQESARIHQGRVVHMKEVK